MDRVATNGTGALNAWLREAAAGAQKGGTLRVVLGNEASDLDSMASALTYALLLDRERGDGHPVSLPLINIPRADFALRTEAVWLFREAGVDASALPFRDGIDPGAAHAGGRLRLVLVDHNRLSIAQSAWASAVEEILDHHADEGLYPGARRVIAPVGSCATLVAERLFESAPCLVGEAVGKLLLGAILLDTFNLDPGARKVTPRDGEMARRLLEIAGADRKAFFDRLQAEKLNVSALSTRDILRKDYKEYVAGGLRYGISSALLPLRDWAGKDPDLQGSLRAYAEERGLALLLVMSVCTEPEFRRELAVYSADRALRDGVIDFLNRSKLGLSPLEAGLAAGAESATTVAAFTQADRGGSRKKVQPLLDGYLKERR